jgi:hypothetical protein
MEGKITAWQEARKAANSSLSSTVTLHGEVPGLYHPMRHEKIRAVAEGVGLIQIYLLASGQRKGKDTSQAGRFPPISFLAWM